MAAADSRRRPAVHPLALLYGILSEETGPAARLLRKIGTNRAQLQERLAGGL